MKIWQKDNEDLDKLFEKFTIGNDAHLDLYLAKYDVIASIAHIKMLEKIKLLAKEEKEKLIHALQGILEKIENNEFEIEKGMEDCHSQIEWMLTQKLGAIGKKVHSGRSRNDQVLVALKLYTKVELTEIAKKVKNLFELLQHRSEKNKNCIMPGYTHMQVAMPSSFGLWFGAFAEGLADDLVLIKSAAQLADQNPLGSGAGYGSSFPLDRELTTNLLHFSKLNYNSIYAQTTRGKLEKITCFAIANLAATLNKLAVDICLFSGQNFGFFRHHQNYVTGSSIMPHKQNPDGFELLRARTNELQSIPNEITMLLTNLSTGYHRDLQLLKEKFIHAIHSIKTCLDITYAMTSKLEINEKNLSSTIYDLMYTVEAVNDEVVKGVPFREAYIKVGKKVKQDTFKPEYQLKHSHIGSIGNLANEEIKKHFDKTYNYFEKQSNTLSTR